jgi:hypothetical protein
MSAPNITWGGLNLSGIDAFGVTWMTTDFQGWDGSPPSTNSSKPKTRAHGAWAGNAFFDARHFVGKGIFKAPTEAALTDAFNRLNDAVSLDDSLLTVVEGATSRWCMARRTDEVIPTRIGSRPSAKWSIQGIADDPRKFSTPITASTHLPSSSGGLTIPYVVPYTIPATQVSGQVSIFNAGNETGPVVMRLDGPCAGPVITHVGSGLRLVFAASATLGVGEWWDIDMEGQSVLANGGPTRAQFVTSRQWSGLEPGNNVWAFTAASYSAGALLTVTGTPADK